MASGLRIQVRSFSGTVLELQTGLDERVLGLRHQIAAKCGVPPVCLGLSAGTQVLENLDSKIADLLTDDSGKIVVTAVISTEPLYTVALHGGPNEKEAAVDDLVLIAARDYERTLEVLTLCVTDRLTKVRLSAIEVLAKIANTGDPRALAAAKQCLKDRSRDVRQAAVEALKKMLDWQNTVEAIEVLSVCLGADAQSDVRMAATEMLGETAPHGDRHAVDALIERLDDDASNVRRAAVCGLKKVALHGDEPAVKALCSQWNDRDWEVRAGATEALADLARTGDLVAIEVCRQLLQDIEGTVRSAAFTALARLDASLSDHSRHQPPMNGMPFQPCVECS